jgi:hypothetical protein
VLHAGQHRHLDRILQRLRAVVACLHDLRARIAGSRHGRACIQEFRVRRAENASQGV